MICIYIIIIRLFTEVNAATILPSSILSACESCAVGQYLNTTLTNAQCASCYPGYRCQGNCSSPIACPIGTHQPSFGESTCTNCSAGYYNIQEGASHCIQCTAGYECPYSSSPPLICSRGFYSIAGAASCSPCSGGTYADSQGLTACKLCPEGNECHTASTGRFNNECFSFTWYYSEYLFLIRIF